MISAAKLLPLLLLAVAAPAEAAPRLILELEHISHPLAGWPCGPANEEAQITQANVLLRWRRGGWYLDAGLGWKLYEKTQTDFFGPSLTGSVRIGREFRLVRR